MGMIVLSSAQISWILLFELRKQPFPLKLETMKEDTEVWLWILLNNSPKPCCYFVCKILLLNSLWKVQSGFSALVDKLLVFWWFLICLVWNLKCVFVSGYYYRLWGSKKARIHVVDVIYVFILLYFCPTKKWYTSSKIPRTRNEFYNFFFSF